MNNQPLNDDSLSFLDEDVSEGDFLLSTESSVWNVLIIDDDPDVHTATMFALNGFRIQGRLLQFHHAYTTAEARQVLLHSRDIAVILLDVVMEDDAAGLQLVNYIRNTLEMDEARIILRTGQAGYAPEIDAIRDYDINDYKSKTELTQTKLYTAITSAIRSFQQIQTISKGQRSLELIIKASTELMCQSDIRSFSNEIISYLTEIMGGELESFVCTANLLQDSATALDNKSSELRIIATSTIYKSWLEKPLIRVVDKPTQTIIQRALYEHKHVYTDKDAALYFSHMGSGNLALYLNQGIPENSNQRRFLEMFCNNVSVCLDNVVLNSRLHNFAYFDPLTGLSNRLQLIQSLNETLCSARRNESALALIDIDHFAETNDALGHQFGDLLLCAVGQRLRMHFNDNCQISRIGNDIFALLGHEEIVSPPMILSLFSKPFHVGEQFVQLSATLGLIKFSDYAQYETEALKDANIALKRAKLRNRSSYSYFTKDMGVEIRERVRMMHALRSAFEDERLFVVYQPQVNMRTGAIVGAEALLRWRGEDGQYVPPAQFIPIAEYSGLIISIGEWVLRSACFELSYLHKLGHDSFKMAVNVSLAQFSHPMFIDTLVRAIRDANVKQGTLELEITESMAMTDLELLIKTLQQIKELGVRISIDDFGTGFSSLNQLQRLNVDKIKIDRAFVNDISNDVKEGNIARMIVQLSENLNLDVIAEGVETVQQAEILMQFGCDHAQGFLYAKPKTKQDLEVWLQENGAMIPLTALNYLPSSP